MRPRREPDFATTSDIRPYLPVMVLLTAIPPLVTAVTSQTVLGTLVVYPFAAFFAAFPFLLVAGKLKKDGTVALLGILSVFIHIVLFFAILAAPLAMLAWGLVEMIPRRYGYARPGPVVAAFTLGYTVQGALMTAHKYMVIRNYFPAYQLDFDLSAEPLSQLFPGLSWGFYAFTVALTAVGALLGAWAARPWLRRYYGNAPTNPLALR